MPHRYQVDPSNVKRHELGRETFASALHGFSGLDVPERPVDAGVIDQLVVRPGFHDPSVGDHVDPIRVADRREAVGDHHHGPVAGDSGQRALDGGFRLVVDGGRGLIEKEDRRVGHERPCD